MVSRRILLAGLLVLVPRLCAALDLPTGPCVVDFSLARTHTDGWCELTLGTGADAIRLGVSTKRASLAAASADMPDVVAAGSAMPAVGASDTYRLIRGADIVALERAGSLLVSAPLAPAASPTLSAKCQGCTIALSAPQPTEPAYLHDDFLRTDKEDGGWSTVRGQWRIGEYRDKLVAALNLAPQATWYETSAAGIALNGDRWWYDLEVSADVLSDAAAGVVFAAQGERHGLLRLREDKVELVVVAGAKETVVAAATWQREPGRWVRLAVASSAGRALARVNGREVLRAAVPTLCSGQVGLWSAAPARFDNVLVTEQRLAWDRLEKGLPDARLWRTHSPSRLRLAPFDAGALTATANLMRDGQAVLALTGEPRLSLTLARRGAQRRFAFRSGETMVAEGDLPTGASRAAVALRRRGALFEAQVDGRRVGATAQAAAGPSFAEVTPAGLLSDVLVQAAPDGPDALVNRADLAPLREDWVGRDESLRTVPDVWHPEQGRWQVVDNRLVGRADSQPARIWYRDTLPADTGLSVTIDELSPDASLTLIAGGGPGLRLEVSAGEAVLTRDGVEVSRTKLAQPPANASLWRDGEWVLADVDGQRLAWRDPKPSGAGQLVLRLSPGGKVALSDVAVIAQNGFASSFGQVDTGWRETGDWQWTSGMACIAWSYWLTGDGRRDPAWLWRREALGHDVTVAFQVSEHTEGYDKGDEDHRHFAYHDISLMLDGDGQDPDSGYRFVIGENKGRGARLLRLGKSVAFDDAMRIEMGGHCNDPRAIRVLATRNGGEVSLTCNGRRVLNWTDPAPLVGGGVVGLGVKDCRANFHDLVALRYRRP